jgi:hypothetical protein
MSELDDLRRQNKELQKLLANALELLEKSKLALTKQAQSAGRAPAGKAAVRGASKRSRKVAGAKVAGKKNH